MTVVFIVLGAAAAVGAWYVDVRLRPWKPCPSCNGRKRTRGSRPAAYGKYHCRRCGGKGEVRRWGAPGEGRLWAARTAAGTARAAGARAPGRSRSRPPWRRRGRRRTAAGAAAPGTSDGDQGAPTGRGRGAVMGPHEGRRLVPLSEAGGWRDDVSAMNELVASHPTLTWHRPASLGAPHAATWDDDDGSHYADRDTLGALVDYLRARLGR